MTDKEIFEKLEAEIERLENYENESVTNSDTRFGWIHGKTFALTSIRVLLDSMQEEPKECMYSKDSYTDEDRKVLCDGCEEKCKFNKKEEPVSEELEEAAKHYLYSNILYDDVYVGNPTDKDCIEMFKAGANWQKQQLMNYAKKEAINTALCRIQAVAYKYHALDVNGDYCEQPFVDIYSELYKLKNEE